MNNFGIDRQEAMNELNRKGIEGAHVYLIDIIPLVEMIWSDGYVQQIEVALLDQFVDRHVKAVNEQAGYTVLTLEDAHAFATTLLETKPDLKWLRELRMLIPPLRFSSPDPAVNKNIWQSILSSCLDIAASAVKDYPYELDERINPDEKRCFFDILESFGCSMWHGEKE